LEAAKGLGVIATAYAGIYAKRAGLTIEEARGIMRAETYFDGAAAVEAGFATAVDDDTDEAEIAAFDYGLYAKAPANLQAAARAVPRRRSRASALAMMAGASLSKPKAKTMPQSKLKPSRITATVSAEEEDDINLS